ncbi:MAG: sensor histidine kinase [Acutalibacteraceae bacterium]
MDTKLKKSDSSYFVKTILFLLIAVFVFYGTFSAVAYAADCSTDSIDDTYYENILSQGKNFRLETSKMFAHEYTDYVNLIAEKALVYGDGSKQAYKNYLKVYDAFLNEQNEQLEKRVDEYIDEELEEIFSDDVYLPELFEKVEQGFIRLSKIQDHTTHFAGEMFFYLGDGEYDYHGAEEYEDVTHPETTYYDEDSDGSIVVPTTFANSEYSYSLSGGKIGDIFYSLHVPENIIEKVKNDSDVNGVVALCRTIYQGQQLDGYYKLTVNRDAVKEEYFAQNSEEYNEEYSDYSFYPQKFSSYDEFRESYLWTEKQLEKYKNFSAAVIDNESNKVLFTNLSKTSTKDSPDEVEAAFLKNEWSVVKNFGKNTQSCGELFAKLQRESNCSVYDEYIRMSTEERLADAGDYSLCISFDTSLSKDDVFSTMKQTYDEVYYQFTVFIIKLAVCVLMTILCIVILIIKSGRRHSDDELHMMFTDKMFFVLRTAINGGLIVLLGACMIELIDQGSSANKELISMGTALCMAVAVLLLTDWLLYITRNLKNKSFHETIFTVWFIKKMRALHRKRMEKRNEKPVFYKDIYKDIRKKTVLFILLPNMIIGLIALILAGGDSWGAAFLFAVPLVIYDIFILVYMVRYAYHLRSVLYAVNQIRNGNYDGRINTNGMPQSIKAYANDVNAINDGLKIAVENAVKEQRTKTELITNVSHDLKTPLTSIINYVDLLSRCDIQDEDAKNYIAVLKDKSARLKRLIEDLVEASKAQAGNVNVNLIKMNLKELVMQLVGEYEDELSAKNLTLVIDAQDEDIFVSADSKMAYRVLDNLLGNVKKYAMPNTRVYLSVFKNAGKGITVLRNISENQLNIPASELMSRFVRGDASRSTDGNGLGLSIAENFCRLQGGKLNIEINGDLFTAVVEYNLAYDPQQEAGQMN